MNQTGFAQWLASQPGTDIQKAARLRLSQQRLSRYKLGQRTPRPGEMYRLMALTGLRAEDFIQRPEPARKAKRRVA